PDRERSPEPIRTPLRDRLVHRLDANRSSDEEENFGRPAVWIFAGVERLAFQRVSKTTNEAAVALDLGNGGPGLVIRSRDNGMGPHFSFQEQPSTRGWKLEHRVGKDYALQQFAGLLKVLFPREAHEIRRQPAKSRLPCSREGSGRWCQQRNEELVQRHQ